MHKDRLTAFTDGTIAIVITIMVLELKVPAGADLAALLPVLPILLSYVLSFAYVAIYWNNHHHLMHAVNRVNSAILWANMNLLFWLSLVPFTTAWLGHNRFAHAPTGIYGVSQLMSALAYFLLQIAIVRQQGPDGPVSRALGHDIKGKTSLVLYIVAIGVSFLVPAVSYALYIAVAVWWLVPDRRIERTLTVP